MDLVRRACGGHGRVHEVPTGTHKCPAAGFSLYRLRPGDRVGGVSETLETLIVIVEGRTRVDAGNSRFGELGQRLDVFDGAPPQAIYLPPGAGWSATATTPCTLAVCTAAAPPGRPVCLLAPGDIAVVTRGRGLGLRRVYPISTKTAGPAVTLRVCEVLSPAGLWSSDPFGAGTTPHELLGSAEARWYLRLNPPDAFGLQRVESNSTAEVAASVKDHDLFLAPAGRWRCAVPLGVEMYALVVSLQHRSEVPKDPDPAADSIEPMGLG